MVTQTFSAADPHFFASWQHWFYLNFFYLRGGESGQNFIYDNFRGIGLGSMGWWALSPLPTFYKPKLLNGTFLWLTWHLRPPERPWDATPLPSLLKMFILFLKLYICKASLILRYCDTRFTRFSFTFISQVNHHPYLYPYWQLWKPDERHTNDYEGFLTWKLGQKMFYVYRK
jgi:hypothetical protein